MARKNTLGYRSARFIKRHRAAVISAAVAALICSALAFLFYRFNRPPERVHSLAVLPFANVTGDPEADYLSDGLTEDLIERLTRLPNLTTRSRGSVSRYKGREADPQAVARDLQAEVILVRRVAHHGETLSVSVELVDARHNRHRWSQQYNRKLAGLRAIQEEIFREVSERLSLKLSGQAEQFAAKRYTHDTEAYQLYLKGRFFWNKRTEESLKKSIAYYEQAVAKAPDYAIAYAGIADSYIILGHIIHPQEAFPKAEAAARKALEIDDTLAEGHTSLGRVKAAFAWDWSAAEREFKRALELDPHYAIAHLWYGEYLRVTGRMDEALAEIKAAQKIDPLSAIVNANLSIALYYARQYDQAIEQCAKVLEIDPTLVAAHWTLGQAYTQKGMYREAVAELKKAVDLGGGTSPLAELGYTYAVLGQTGEAKKVKDKLNEMAAHRYVTPYHLAAVCVGLKEKEQALKWLEEGYHDRSPFMPNIGQTPMFDSLRSDPRFVALVRRIGLPQ